MKDTILSKSDSGLPKQSGPIFKASLLVSKVSPFVITGTTAYFFVWIEDGNLKALLAHVLAILMLSAGQECLKSVYALSKWLVTLINQG